MYARALSNIFATRTPVVANKMVPKPGALCCTNSRFWSYVLILICIDRRKEVLRARKQLYATENPVRLQFSICIEESVSVFIVIKRELSFLKFWRMPKYLRNTASDRPRWKDKPNRLVSSLENAFVKYSYTRCEWTELMVKNDEWRGELWNGKWKFLGYPPLPLSH